MGYYRARKTDFNQRNIVNALKAAGCFVIDLSATGKGVPDLAVLPPNQLRPVLMEVKNKAGKGDKLTPAQVKLHAEYWGAIHRVTSVDEALAAIFPKLEQPQDWLDSVLDSELGVRPTVPPIA